MKFSVFHIAMGRGRTSDRQVYDDLLADISLAERLPFDVFWLAEHHFNSNFSMSPSPNILLGAAAVMTKRIKIGTAINVLPFYNPVRLAEETAQLNLLSNGRFQWGIGRGIPGHEFDGYGAKAANSAEWFREVHDFVLNAWKTGDLGWDGKFFKVPSGTHLAPAMSRTAIPPIWMSAQSPSSVDWAAQHGYPALQVAETIERGRGQVKRYAAAAAAAGVTVGERGMIVPCRYVFVAETEKEVREVVAPNVMGWWHEFAAIAAPQKENLITPGYEYWKDPATAFRAQTGHLNFDELNEAGIILVGTPKQVIGLLEKQISELNLKHMICDFWRAGKKREDRQRSMTLFGEQVIPYFS